MKFLLPFAMWFLWFQLSFKCQINMPLACNWKLLNDDAWMMLFSYNKEECSIRLSNIILSVLYLHYVFCLFKAVELYSCQGKVIFRRKELFFFWAWCKIGRDIWIRMVPYFSEKVMKFLNDLEQVFTYVWALIRISLHKTGKRICYTLSVKSLSLSLHFQNDWWLYASELMRFQWANIFNI